MPTRSSSVPSRVSREFDALRRHLTQWRATRPHLRAAIPEPLWAEAVLLAQQHGVSETAVDLHLNRLFLAFGAGTGRVACRDAPIMAPG